MTNWVEITVEADLEAVEPLSELLSRYTYGGVAIEQGVMPEGEPRDQAKLSDMARVSGYLPARRGWKQKVRQIEVAASLLGQLRPVGVVSWQLVDQDDWTNVWKEHYRPLRIGERILVKPSWEDYPIEPGQVLVELDPGMAFGTGLHPTTQLCLRQLERHVRPGSRVFDVGTGSGILAIAAARLGASSVLAVDNDTVAVETARRNVALNGLTGSITIGSGSVATTGRPMIHNATDESVASFADGFDLVVANIVAAVICELARGLVQCLKIGGVLIVSGIIDGKVDMVTMALSTAGLTVQATDQMGDWFTIVGTK